MKNSLFKKSFAVLLAVLMLFTAVPAGVFAAEKNLPVMEAYNAASSGDYHKYYNSVYTVTFLDEIDYDVINASDTLYSWDVSAAKDGSVMAWMKLNADATVAAKANRYDVYIAGDGGIKANADSSYIFYCFSALTEVNGLEHLKTDDVTTFFRLFEKCSALKTLDMSSLNTSKLTNMNYLFSECKALVSVDLSGWDTSNVTTMAYVFNNCFVLAELDISSFDTRKVTDMNHLFFNCHELAEIYVGEGWNIDNVVNGNSVFNCCYALMGGIENYDNSKTGIDFATTGANGFLKSESEKPQAEKYTVTYTFIGDNIPDDVTAPGAVTYEKGATVTVEDKASAEHYIFSGWTTEDNADIKDGKFVINNDVEFVGSWTKLYKVVYEYDSNYMLPDGAPEIPDVEYWYAPGEDVPIYGIPNVPEYVFVGWTTKDAEIIGDGFKMPENDVTIRGFFKKPVESVEIWTEDFDLDVSDEEGKKINVYVKPEDATIKDLVYISDDESVVKVDENGVVTPVGEGTTTVTVQSVDNPEKSDTITVTVKTFVTDIEVDKTDITLYKNETDKITGTVIPDKATDKKVVYASGDEKVVKVDENGNITAVGEGTTTITVSSADNPDVKKEVTVTVKVPVTEVTAKDNISLNIGEVENVDASVNDDATVKDVAYESDKPYVAKVDNDGNVTAVGEGTATITITSKDDPTKSTKVTVNVVKKYKVTYEIVSEVKPDGIAVPSEENYNNGTTVTVENGYNVEGYTFSGWSTDDAEVTDGKFVISKDVHFVGSFKKDVADVTADKTDITLTEGETDNITVTVTPDDAANKEVTYESSDESVVKVDANGNIEAVSEGEATITITSKDDPTKSTTVTVTVAAVKYKVTYEYEGTVPVGAPTVPGEESFKAGIKVGVKDEPSVSGYSFIGWYTDDAEVSDGEFTMPEKDVVLKGSFEKINIPVNKVVILAGDLDLKIGDERTITVLVYPNNATNKEVAFESDNESVVTIDENGNIKAVGEGTAIIKAISKADPSKYDEITIVVTKPDVHLESISAESMKLDIGETEKLEVTFIPEDTTNKRLSYSSTDESVVTVDEYGNVTAVGKGEAYITVTPNDKPTAYINVKVTVNVPVTEINLVEKEIELEEGNSYTVIATVNPDNATDKSVIYTSSDESVVTVDKDGKITAVKEGTATVTVTSASDPDVKKTVTVRVNPPKNPGHTIVTPESVSINEGETKNLGVTITPDDGTIKPVYTSSDESVVTVDADGNITGIKAGIAAITVDLGNGDIRVIPVVVVETVIIPVKHYICFGKTDGIGWYEVSVNGGDFFPQGPNSTLEVDEGSVLVVRVQDMWIDDEFDFYVNGSKVPMDAANTITVVVDGYMLIGALSMDVEVPDVDESLTIFEKISNFFAKIINWFKNLFTW